MGFLNWLYKRAPKVEDPPPDLSFMTEPPSVPDQDCAETARPVQPDQDQPLENLFCTIEYTDSGGHRSQRPVTFLSVTRRYSMPAIIAVCHMRRAMRTFRVDRIHTIITADGEVFDGATFLTKVMHLDLSPTGNTFKFGQRIPKPASRDFRELILSPMTVLVACGKADGNLHVEEVDRIMSWAESEAVALRRASAIDSALTIEQANALGTTIAGMRPQARTLRRHMAATITMPEDALARFRRTLQKVIVADGLIHGAEVAFIEDFDALAADPALLASFSETH